MATLHFNVRGDHGEDTPVLITDNPPGGTIQTGTFESPGRFVLTCPANVSGGAWLFYMDRRKSFRVILPPGDGSWEAGAPPCLPPEYNGDAEQVAIVYELPVQGLPEIYMDGTFPRLRSDNSEFLINGATGFRAYARYLAGEFDILDAFCRDLMESGSNFCRFWLLADTVPLTPDPALQYRLDPRIQFAFYERIPKFVEYLSRFALYPDAVAFTRTKTLMPNRADQLEHFRNCAKALAPFPGILSPVNENNAHDNRVDEAIFAEPKPAGAKFLLTTGSMGADGWPDPTPHADLAEFHSNDLKEWQRRSGKNCWEYAQKHTLGMYCSEQTRATDKDNNPHHFYDNAVTMSAMGSGGVFHSTNGKNAEPYTEEERRRALDHSIGMRAGGITGRRGPYKHRTDLERPEPPVPAIIRGYQMGSFVWTIRGGKNL